VTKRAGNREKERKTEGDGRERGLEPGRSAGGDYEKWKGGRKGKMKSRKRTQLISDFAHGNGAKLVNEEEWIIKKKRGGWESSERRDHHEPFVAEILSILIAIIDRKESPI